MPLITTVGYIEVTGCDLAALVRAAYSPSRQQGLGVFDQSGRADLTDESVEQVLERGRNDPMCAVGIDYLNGRSVKMHVYKDGERLFIPNTWYDHSDAELAAFLEQIGIAPEKIELARKEEADDRAACTKAAVDYLRERGGQILQNRGLRTIPKPEDALPKDVERGLWSAHVDGLVTEDYQNDTGLTLWKLTQGEDL